MNKSARSGVVGYADIAEKLNAEIRAGKYSVRRSFPNLTKIMQRFDVTRVTAMRSVDELKRRGVIAAVPKSGIVVRRAASRKIGLIVPGVAVTDFFKPVVSEINRLARNAGYELRFGEVWGVDGGFMGVYPFLVCRARHLRGVSTKADLNFFMK